MAVLLHLPHFAALLLSHGAIDPNIRSVQIVILGLQFSPIYLKFVDFRLQEKLETKLKINDSWLLNIDQNQNGLKIESRDFPSGLSPLHMAAREGQVQKFLIILSMFLQNQKKLVLESSGILTKKIRWRCWT